MQAKLSPGPGLEEFFEGTNPSRERHEAIGKLGHHGFALVHRANDAKIGQTRVPDLKINE